MEESEFHAKKKKQAKKVTFTITFGLVVKVIVFALIAALMFGIYQTGYNNGKKQAKTISPTLPLDFRDRIQPGGGAMQSRRWSAIGTITDVNDKTIKIKDSRDKEESANFTKDTSVIGSDGKKTDVKALKKGQKIIISGEKDDKDQNRTVTRIRIQK